MQGSTHHFKPEETATERQARITDRLIAFLAEHDGSEELYQILHGELGLSHVEMEALGFHLAHHYEYETEHNAYLEEAVQAVRDYLCFIRDTTRIWPWFLSIEEILYEEGKLQEIGKALHRDPKYGYDTEEIYQALVNAFGVNPMFEPDPSMELI